MKKSIVIVLSFLCVALLAALPFVLSSPDLLDSAFDEMYYGEEDAFLRLFPAACAEEETAAENTEAPEDTQEDFGFSTGKQLPIDYLVGGSEPDPSLYTDFGYEDDTISVRLETLEQDGVTWRLAYVRIADASQLRTTVAGTPKLTSTTEVLPSSMAKAMNAVVAIGGDNFANEPKKKTFEYRMGVMISASRNSKKDTLVIDENGDFHTVILLTDEHLAKLNADLEAEGHTIVNAFTFGPVLVKDGQKMEIAEAYGYASEERNPRCAIGQMGPLSYVLILAEGRNGTSEGATMQELADFAYALGCKEAYNLDGGNSAVLIFNNSFYMDKNNKERPLNDILYFASARDADAEE